MDWWKITIDDAITALSGAAIVNGCIRSDIQSLCDLYSRVPGGAILDLLATTQNIGGGEVEGYDLTINYRFPETAWGKFSFNWDTTYMANQIFDVDGDGILGEDNTRVPVIGQPFFSNEGGNTVGEFGATNLGGPTGTNSWRIRSNLSTRWEKGDIGATWNLRYFSSQEEGCQGLEDYGYGFLCTDTDRFVGVPRDVNNNGVWDGEGIDEIRATPAAQHHIGAATYHDVSLYWNAPWNAKLTVGVNNLFDKSPPLALTAFANSSDPQYDLQGRFMYFRYSQKF